jgi:L,D-transpeptidase ErfK/SrfK
MVIGLLRPPVLARVPAVWMLWTVLLLLSGPVCGAEFALPRQGTDIVGDIRVVTARSQDTLLDIARRHNLGFNEITSANPGIDPWLPGDGTRVVVPTQFVLPPGPRQGIVINMAQLRLFYFPVPTRGKPANVITYPIGIGVELASTPLGLTRVVRKAKDPAWYPPQQIRAEREKDGVPLPDVVPSGPSNPLGKYALYLGLSGYLIHGTNRPWGIGMRVSHGCIRMNPEDIESLHQSVPVGTPVRILDEPYLFGMLGPIPYLQALRTPEAPVEENLTPLVRRILLALPRNVHVDWDKTMAIAAAKRGIPVPISAGTPGIAEIVANAHREDAETGDAR